MSAPEPLIPNVPDYITRAAIVAQVQTTLRGYGHTLPGHVLTIVAEDVHTLLVNSRDEQRAIAARPRRVTFGPSVHLPADPAR